MIITIIIIIVILIFCKHSPWSIIFTNRSRVRCPTAGRRSALIAAASTCPTYTFVLLPFTLVSLVTRRLRGATSTIGSSQRDGDISPLPACLSLYRFFSLLYSYRYIVTLRNGCDGGHLCVAVPLLYFLIFLLNKCEHAESINMCVSLHCTPPCHSLS